LTKYCSPTRLGSGDCFSTGCLGAEAVAARKKACFSITMSLSATLAKADGLAVVIDVWYLL